jgi:hypothetical protein
MIRGQTGEGARGVIPEEAYADAVALGRTLSLETRILRITGGLWERSRGDLMDMMGARFLDHPAAECVLSADFGTTAPTEIGIWFKYAGGETDIWGLWGRITLLHMAASAQAQIFDTLATVYQPLYISIDSTAATNPVTQILTDPMNMNYNAPEKDYMHRIFEAKFNGDVTARYVIERPDTGGREYKKVVVEGVTMYAARVPANEFATDEIVRALMERSLALPPCDALRADMMGMTCVWSGRQMVYKGTPQHIVSMVRAFTLLYHAVYTLKRLERAAVASVRDAAQGACGIGVFRGLEYGGDRYERDGWHKGAG